MVSAPRGLMQSRTCGKARNGEALMERSGINPLPARPAGGLWLYQERWAIFKR